MSKDPIKEAQKHLPSKAPAALKKFLRDFYARVPEEDLRMMEPALIAKTAQIHWDLSRKRRSGGAAISIYTTQLDKNRPGAGHTVIDLVNDDMAFLVDSVAAEIRRHRKLIRLLLHPIMQVRTGSGGKVTGVSAEGKKTGRPQSHMHIEIQGALTKSQIPQLERDLRQVLKDVEYATSDWLKIREKLRTAQEALASAPGKYSKSDIEEYTNFLDYMYKDNFTLLGFREYKFAEDAKGKIKSQIIPSSSLGLLHDDMKPVYIAERQKSLPQDLQRLRRDLPPLSVSKVNKRSTVHRPVPLDAVAVKKYDKKTGKVVGEYLFIGLFTSVTYSRSIQDIPLLRHKAESVMTRSGFKPGSHNFKALRHILEKYPRDELFQTSVDGLLKTALSILRLQERQRIALYMRKDPFRRHISCLVYVPRDRYDARLRITIQKILEEELQGACSDIHTNLDDSVLARVLYVVEISQSKPPRFDLSWIESRLEEAGRLWGEKLAEALLGAHVPEKDIPEVVHRYGDAFPAGYRDAYLPKRAVYDIQKIEQAVASNGLALDLYRDKECSAQQMRLKIYSKGAPIILSDVLPVLENMGLQVLSELPFEVGPEGLDGAVWIHDFMMATKASCTQAQIDARKPAFEEAFLKIWQNEMENDSLNHLVLGAGMNWRDIMILRTYVRYLRQARSTFSTAFVERCLHHNAIIAGHAVALFKALLDPGPQGKSSARASSIRSAIDRALDKVLSLEEDRALRSIIGMISATLRTNFFQPDAQGNLKTYLSIKLDSHMVADLPDPKPYREIFVYSPRVEAIHLRGDVIARGGIRWSDRFEDFRTEVLGLMKAQQVKNSLIVPMGAKGGFVVKKPPSAGGRAAYLQEGIECYKIFVRGLLDITDNRKGKRLIPPAHVIRRDGDDPYLVVAADKGTATFSDIANGLSAEYGFWLGDAFASGGSAGYDHKKMGITARGAWESVKRHFRELGHNTQTHPFDIVGVGDMGGDVFGNGMILSEKIRLIGAFNHAHIFCDPDPDPASTFRERKRLFDAVKGWDEYNTKYLSKGGRIYSRSDKSLLLTPEIRKRFEIDRDRVTPAELIQALLRARTDMLWFGGIGTYIKSSLETHADVGDKTNDSLRVSAPEVRARVIGEGANLALTQSARIEMAAAGIKLNADFIDNSGGVNSSDLEVNIKILLSEVMSSPKSKMTLAGRNALLSRMTGEVAQLVLRNSYQQVQGISLMELRAPENLPIHSALIDDLERRHGISRRLEKLPSAEEIELRLRAGKGLTRPELCILQAHAKIIFAKDILKSDLPDMPEMERRWLCSYFPRPLQEKYAAEIRSHRLRREIIATTLSTSMINRMGATFVKEMEDKTGASCADVAKAFLIVREAFNLSRLWERIEALDGRVPADIQLRAMREIARMAERETIWFLTKLGRPLNVDSDIRTFGEKIGSLYLCLDSVVTEDLAQAIEQRRKIGMDEGLPHDLAHQVALISPLGAACDIIRASLDQRADITGAARIYFELGDRFHLHWLRQQARFLPASTKWASDAQDSVIEQLYASQAGLTSHILRDMKGAVGGKKRGADIVSTWVSNYAPQAAQFEVMLADMRRGGTIDLPMLIIVGQRLRQIYGG